jgi:hypothetical protein
MKLDSSEAGWRFFTNHLHVLACLARDPALRIRDIAVLVGITERAAAQILRDLQQAGYVSATRVGRRNRYAVHNDLPLRHPLHGHRSVGELLDFLAVPSSGARTSR